MPRGGGKGGTLLRACRFKLRLRGGNTFTFRRTIARPSCIWRLSQKYFLLQPPGETMRSKTIFADAGKQSILKRWPACELSSSMQTLYERMAYVPALLKLTAFLRVLPSGVREDNGARQIFITDGTMSGRRQARKTRANTVFATFWKTALGELRELKERKLCAALLERVLFL